MVTSGFYSSEFHRLYMESSSTFFCGVLNQGYQGNSRSATTELIREIISKLVLCRFCREEASLTVLLGLLLKMHIFTGQT